MKEEFKPIIQEGDLCYDMLSPGDPDNCMGNGEMGHEICCDECDFFSEMLP